MCFFLICLPPWQETFAEAGDGDGWVVVGGTNWDNLRIVLDQFLNHFKIILGPHMRSKYFFNQQSTFLNLHVLFSSPLFEQTYIGPWLELEITKYGFENLIFGIFKRHSLCVYIVVYVIFSIFYVLYFGKGHTT